MEKDFKELKTALDKLGYLLHKSEIATFEEFLEYVIAQHSHTITKDLSKSSKEIKTAYFECYSQYVKLQYLKVHKQHKEWFDAFGLYFEIHSSKWSRDKKGQFFTPEPICEFMVRCYVNENMEKETVFDPACGSGRFLLASHAYNPKNYHYGQDVDYTCCLMSVVNMMFHGIQGEVVHGNSLDPDSYFSGWSINPNIVKLKGIPHIEHLEKENSFIFHVSQSHKKERLEELERLEQEKKEELKKCNFLEIQDKDKIEFEEDTTNDASFEFF